MKMRLSLIAVIVAAGALRLPVLDRFPPPLYQDEASRLYDAWCLLETGADRHGARLPLMLESFGEGDYTAALTTYLTLPFVGLLGPTATAVRLPAALLSVATVLLLFVVVRRVWDARSALASALILALDPWHVAMCRTGHESAFAPFLLALALYAAVRAGLLREVNAAPTIAPDQGASVTIWASLSGLMFGLHTWVYPATRLFTPLFLLAIFFIFPPFRRRGMQSVEAAGVRGTNRQTVIAAIMGLIIGTSPLWTTAASHPERIAARSRVAIWAQPPEIVPHPVARFIENMWLNLSPTHHFIRFDELSGVTLEGVGLHLIVTAPVWIIGLVLMIGASRERRWSRLLIAWLLIYPVPAAICADWNPHSYRTIGGMLLYPILAAVGWRWLIDRLPQARHRMAALVGVGLMALSMGYAIDRYVRDSGVMLENGYQTGLIRAMQYVGEHVDGADFVLVTREFNQPYIYALLYAPIKPAELSALPKISGPDMLGFHQFNRIGKFFFPPRRPDQTPELTARFQAAFENLPPDAEGLVIELAGKFPEGRLLATFASGTQPAVEVRRWRPSSADVN